MFKYRTNIPLVQWSFNDLGSIDISASNNRYYTIEIILSSFKRRQ
jgi:hypothetical protein